EVEAIFRELEEAARRKFESENVGFEDVAMRRSTRMRFAMQIHDVEVPVRAGTIDDAGILQLERDFELVHDQLFGKGSGFREGGTDFTAFQVRATARTTRPNLL